MCLLPSLPVFSFSSRLHLHFFIIVIICTCCTHLSFSMTSPPSPLPFLLHLTHYSLLASDQPCPPTTSHSLLLLQRWNIHAHPYWECSSSSSQSHRSQSFQRLRASELTERGGGKKVRCWGGRVRSGWKREKRWRQKESRWETERWRDELWRSEKGREGVEWWVKD